MCDFEPFKNVYTTIHCLVGTIPGTIPRNINFFPRNIPRNGSRNKKQEQFPRSWELTGILFLKQNRNRSVPNSQECSRERSRNIPGIYGIYIPGTVPFPGIFPFFLGITIPYRVSGKVGTDSQEYSWEYSQECSRNIYSTLK